MMSKPCDYLDGYLGRWLDEPERQAFAAHLESCPLCRQAVAEQRRLDELLVRAVGLAGPVPIDLSARIERRLTVARRRRLLAGMAALAAASVLLAVVMAWLIHGRRIAPQVVETPAPPPAIAAARVATQVTVSTTPGLTAVPIESRNPALTIVWLFHDRPRPRHR